MSAEAKNLEAIDKAIHQRALRCPGQLIEIRMAPYEVERLDWTEYKGIPIVGDPEMGTGRFRLVCEREELKPAPTGTGIEVHA